MTYKYKSKDGNDFFVPGVGKSVGGILETDKMLESHSLTLVVEQIPAPAAPIVPAQPAPPAVPTPVTPLNNEEQE